MINATTSAKGYAKVNLGLKLLGCDELGMHLIDTIFYKVTELFDIIEIEFEKNTDFAANYANYANISEKTRVNLQVIDQLKKLTSESTIENKLPQIEQNIVTKAFRLLYNLLEIDSLAQPLSTFKITLTKRIPIGAGLAGGSADAAATLIAANEFFNKHFAKTATINQLSQLAIILGADVNFALVAALGEMQCARGTHYGEILQKIDTFDCLELSFHVPHTPNSTCQVFQKYDELMSNNNISGKSLLTAKAHQKYTIDEIVQLLEKHAKMQKTSLPETDKISTQSCVLNNICPSLLNDLLIPALEINSDLQELFKTEEIANNFAMTGSGSTLFTIKCKLH